MSPINPHENQQIHRPTIRPIYVVVGYLDEYFGGRRPPLNGAIEHFHLNEVSQADAFAIDLEALRAEHAIEAAIERFVQDGHTYFRCDPLAALIERFYAVPIPSEPPRQSIREDHFAPLTSIHLSSGCFDDRIAFVLGAYRRAGNAMTIRLANATHKASLLANVLRAIGCPKVRWTWQGAGAPAVNEIEFEPSKDLAALLL